jgi:hypothetical protein
VDPYREALDGLAFPADWHAVKTVARGDGGDAGCVRLADFMCPSVTRYYGAAGGLVAVHDEARSTAEQAGFAVTEDTSPNCDFNTVAARCAFVATKGPVRLEVYVFDPGVDPDRVGVGTPGQPTVRIIALPH